MSTRRLDRIAAVMALLSLGYLCSRIFTGIDFTDEMQHYGELVALVSTGRLFQADLFLQQAMYVFLYPIFYLYHLLMGGWDYLVVAGRVFMVLGYVAAAGLAFRRSATDSARYPGWAAASIALAWLPFNILSPYYNALAGLLISLIVFLWTSETRARTYLVLSTLAISMLCVTYPTLGLAVGLLLVGDELRSKRYWLAIKMLTLLAAFGAAWGAVLWGVIGNVKDIRDAIAFSKDFGVGYALSDPRHLSVLSLIILAGLLFAYQGAKWVRAAGSWGMRFLVPLAAVACWWLTGRGGWLLTVALYLGTLFLLRYLPAGVQEKDQVARLGVFGLLVGAVSALTSGNGIINIAIGMGSVLPYLGGLLLKGSAASSPLPACGEHDARPLQFILVFGLLLVINNILHPYRDEPAWRLGYSLDHVPVFRGITASEEKHTATKLIQAVAGPAASPGQSLMVIGPQPWVYFALMAEPRTPMLFMHFSGGQAASRIIASRLTGQTRPDHILVMSQPPVGILAALAGVLGDGYQCETVTVNFPQRDAVKVMEQFGFVPGMQMCRVGPKQLS